MEILQFSEAFDAATSPFEVIERKGRGHPDTLADRLAESLSCEYALICREMFGTVLRHQFDKLSLMGGKCDVRFGGGHFISPVRLLINGRVTPAVGNQKLVFRDRLVECAETFLERELRNFDFHLNCRLMIETTSNTTRGINLGDEFVPGPAHSRFRPAQLADLPEYTRPLSNDTALGCAWAPYSPLEQLVLQIEGKLNSDQSHTRFPWLGSDIKTMAVRHNSRVDITICVPQISTAVPNHYGYVENTEVIEQLIAEVVDDYGEGMDVSVAQTPGDRSRIDLAYLLLTGSCIESGDEGQVARGNRMGGLIASRRPFSIEGLSGKNPQYHGGKIYAAAAWDIASDIWRILGEKNEVYIISQTDRPLDDPWRVIVNTVGAVGEEGVRQIVEANLADVNRFTDGLIRGDYPLV